MIRVVGKDKSAIKRITCKNCASILEYTINETRIRHSTYYGGSPGGCEWVVCPACGNGVITRSW